jgi:acyl-coenzyme A synthetase/AMP-(fatty) acid ligase
VAAVVLAPGVAVADIAGAAKHVLNRRAAGNRVVAIDALPRNDNGKLLRGAVAELLVGARV